MKTKAKLLALNLAILMLLLAVLPIPAAAGAAALPAALRGGAGIGTEGDLIAYAEEKTEVMTEAVPGDGTPTEKQFAPTQSGWYEIRLSGQDTVSLAVKDGSGAAVDGIGNAEADSNGVIRNAHTVSFTAYLQAGTQYQLRCTASLTGSLTVYAETPRTMQLGRLYCLNDNISTVFSLTADNCRTYQCLLSSNSDLMLYREDGRQLASCEDAGSVFLPGNSTYYAICYAGELRFTCGSSLCSWDEGKITLAPTETTEGIFTYTCTVCGATRTEPLAPAPHTHQYVPTVIEPTCTKAGYTLYQCLCGLSYTGQTVPALGHDDAVTEAVEPTCTAPGKTAGIACARCGEVLTAQEEIPALGHDYKIDETVEPTCTKEGSKNGVHCTRCGDELLPSETIPALGHNYKIDETVEPTCTKEGSKNGAHCTRCGDELLSPETIPALGHDYAVTEAVEPTCTEPGKTAGVICARCGEVFTAQIEIPALGHNTVTDPAAEPTCTEPGKTEGSHCDRCGEVFTAQKDIPAPGHDWDEGKVTKEATEDADGEMLYTCSRCKETRTEVIPSLNHEHKFEETVVPPTCTEQGYTLHECYCGQDSYKDNYVDALGHEPVTDAAVAATCTESGLTEGSRCAVCGEVLTAQEELAALGHDIVTDEAVAATCTEQGLTEGSHCERCGEIFTAQTDIPALGHNYENGTCTNCGEAEPTESSEPVETEPIETEPIETQPIETEPIETEPIETEPIETEPIETHPTETEPIETHPTETEPIETEPVETAEPCEGYTDIDRSSWYHEAADFVLARGIMSSTKTDSLVFEPYTVCTRAMIATMLYSLEGKPEVTFEAKFPDVKEGQWFTAPVMWAYQSGVVTGYDNGSFGPNDKVTREQMAVILKAYAEKVKGLDTTAVADLSDFADVAKVTWSKPYIRWAVAEGLLSGKAQNGKLYLDPQGNATRAEVAAIMKSFITKVINK